MSGIPAVPAPARKHLHEWPFWCLLATRTASAVEKELLPLLDDLSGHAARLSLPVRYEAAKGALWASICRLFILFRVNGKDAGRIGYVHMIFGIGRAFKSPRFAKIAFGKIREIVLSPSGAERTFQQSVADAFLVNGATRSTPFAAPGLEQKILGASTDDHGMLGTAVSAVVPPAALWDATVAEYYQRRAGYLRTMFSSAKRWREDLEETAAGKPGTENHAEKKLCSHEDTEARRNP